MRVGSADPSVPKTAARYFTRLMSGTCTDEERREINAWLDASPRHWCAFQRLGRAWSNLALILERDPDVETAPESQTDRETH